MPLRQPGILVWFGVLATLSGGLAQAQNGGVQLHATIGIGGRYRAGGWVPFTVQVVNPGPQPLHGQIQIGAVDADGTPNGDAIFSCPVDVPPGPQPQHFQVETRGIDPSTENVVVRLVDGAARGDGATLAQIATTSPSSPTVFTNNPVSAQDVFVVGLSADSTAITRLNGPLWGWKASSPILYRPNPFQVPPPPASIAGGPSSMAGPPPTMQAVAAVPSDLPEHAEGYDGVDAVVLRGDAPLDALSEEQTDALKAWVAAGGRLIVFGGPDPAPYGDAFYTGLLPASVRQAASGSLVLTPLLGAQVLASAAGHPAIVAGSYGAGAVMVLAAGTATPAQWKVMLTQAAASSLLRAVAARQNQGQVLYFGNYSGSNSFSDIVMRAPALNAPGAGLIGLFLFCYVLILVPLNIQLLKRLDRKEWAWGTIPALALLFASVTYGIGYAAKGSRVFVNRAALVETAAGQHAAGVMSAIGLFSPQRTSYDMTLVDPTALAAPPLAMNTRYAGMYRQSASMPDSPGQVNVVEDSGLVRVQDVAVNMWAMRSFEAPATTDLGGVISASLVQQSPQNAVGVGNINGTIVNRTPHSLRHCLLYLRGSWQTLPDLPPGGSVPVSVSVGQMSAMVSGQPYMHSSNWVSLSQMGLNGSSTPTPVEQQMQSALLQYVSSLGQSSYMTGYSGSGGSQQSDSFDPGVKEGILLGWCDDPALAGPPVQVDGHSVTQNSVTLVVVHLPVR